MKIVGLMLVRNEDWIIAASLQAACRWCDEIVILLDRCTDRTADLVAAIRVDTRERITILPAPVSGEENEFWNEMHMRQRMLRYAREIRGADVFGLIDADEIPTLNAVLRLRGLCEQLTPGQVLDLPMIPVWGDLNHYRHDASVWSSSMLSVAVRDTEGGTLTHTPDTDGYQHHNRVPAGVHGRYAPWTDKAKEGGIMHLQFANRRRLLAKHVLYRMIDHLRWPDRETVAQLNRKYDQALDETGMIRFPMPPEWWNGLAKDAIVLDGIPWQEEAVHKLISGHGLNAFEGLDLKGFENQGVVERCHEP